MVLFVHAVVDVVVCWCLYGLLIVFVFMCVVCVVAGGVACVRECTCCSV